MFPPPCLTCSWGHRQHSSSSKHCELSWCQRAGFWFHLTTTLSVLVWIIGKLQTGCTCAFLRRGTLRALEDSSPSRRSVLPIVFLVTMVPAALRSLTRSSRVILGWFLTVLRIIETPRGEILHAAPDRGRLTVTVPSTNIISLDKYEQRRLWK